MMEKGLQNLSYFKDTDGSYVVVGQDAIEKAIELEVDGMIYFGDGDIWSEDVLKPKFPFLWAMVRGNKAPVDWGAVCQVEVENER